MKLLAWIVLALTGLVLILLTTQVRPSPAQLAFPSLSEWHVVDLTQPLTPTIPICPGDPDVEIQPWASYDEDGYFINRLTIGEHSGTHWGTPNTFTKGATSAEQVPVEKLVAPAIVIDVRDKAVQDEDYRLSVKDVQTWETANGQVPSGSVVILLTGWQERWGDPAAFIN